MTFKRPRKVWDTARIKEDRILLSKYGLRRKRELWKAEEILTGKKKPLNPFFI